MKEGYIVSIDALPNKVVCKKFLRSIAKEARLISLPNTIYYLSYQFHNDYAKIISGRPECHSMIQLFTWPHKHP